MTRELPKTYDFNETEARLYQMWWDQVILNPGMIPTSRVLILRSNPL